MKWLIVEDSLRDRGGHWYEYIGTFYRELRSMDDDVTVLVDRDAEAFVRTEFNARAMLPASVWHSPNMDSALRRILRIPTHAWQTFRAVRVALLSVGACDLAFFPTVAAPHLLAAAWLAKGPLRRSHTKLVLLFIHLPIRWSDARQQPEWDGSLTSQLFRRLVAWLRPEIESRRVVLAAEPDTLGQALASLSRVPVLCVPQPVHRFHAATHAHDAAIRVTSLGGARAEKGSDLLQQAILSFLDCYPDSKISFALQWGEDFVGEDGQLVRMDPRLATHPRVEVLPRFTSSAELDAVYARTDAVILPYRLVSYRLRGSRVVIEAMVNGVPIIAPRQSSMARQIAAHGAGVEFEDGDLASLVAAIAQLERNYSELRTKAAARRAAAQDAYSVAEFRSRVAHAIS